MHAWRSLHHRVALLLALSLCGPATLHAAGVRVAASPGALTVAPGDTFTVQVEVPLAGDPFNTYQAVISFDPAVLRFLNRPQSAQEGPLLIDACPGHSTFYTCATAADSIDILDSMMGAGCVTPGPGTLLNLRFIALGPTGLTAVHLRRVKFYNDGLYVNPVLPSDAIIQVGSAAGAGPSPPASEPLRLTVSPNPSRGLCWLTPGAAARGASEIRILDATGRIVRRLALDPLAPGRLVPWDGRDTSGRMAPPGVYAAVARGSGLATHALLVRLP